LVERHLFKRMILERSFYEQEVITVATKLLGKILVHETVDGTTAGRIVETEAYMGPEDEAAHSSGGRRTARNEIMYGSKGRAYVYFIYGLYYCLNVTAGIVPGKPEAVLLRAIEPVLGEDIMIKRRQLPRGKKPDLTNGPSKLCMAMAVSKIQNKADITAPPLYIDDAPAPKEHIAEATRIGVDYAGEWKNKRWRFYLKANPFVSKE